eukprot:4673341-Pleurochrysis_carterae.AAC.1
MGLPSWLTVATLHSLLEARALSLPAAQARSQRGHGDAADLGCSAPLLLTREELSPPPHFSS